MMSPRAGVDARALRDYQSRLLADIDTCLAKGTKRNRVLLQSETGSGKSLVAAVWISGRLTAGPSLVVGWVTHTNELKEQAVEALENCDVSVAYFSNTVAKRQWNIGGVTVFSPTTKVPPPPPGSILLVDEAHHSLAPSWRQAIEAGWDIVLGLTATPCHLKKSADFREVWDALLVGPSYKALRSDGFLVDYKVCYPSHGAVVKREVLQRDASGEFTNKTVVCEITRLLATQGTFAEWEAAVAELEDKRTILFAPSVDAATEATVQFNKCGVPAAVLHSKTPKAERKAIVEGFHSGRYTLLANVAVVTEGFDCPAAAVVVLLRPTSSLGLHRQMMGRALRILRGKRFAVILDLAGNTLQHGGPDRTIKWSLKPRSTYNHHGSLPYAVCPHSCGAVNSLLRKRCVRCDGRLRFVCGSCFRDLIFREFQYRAPEVADPDEESEDEEPEAGESESDTSTLGIVDRETFCLECMAARLKARAKRVKAIEKKMMTSVSPDRWKWMAPRHTDKPWGWQIKVSANLPDCPDANGTLFAFHDGQLMVHSVHTRTIRRTSAYGRATEQKVTTYKEERNSWIPVNRPGAGYSRVAESMGLGGSLRATAAHLDMMTELLRLDLSFMAAMHLTCVSSEAPTALPPDSTFYGALRYRSHSWKSPRSVAERKQRSRSPGVQRRRRRRYW